MSISTLGFYNDISILIDSTATTVAGGDPQAWARRRKRRFNKHKHNRKLAKMNFGHNSSRMMDDEIVPEDPVLREIEIRLMPLDTNMIKKVKAQGIKVNLSRPKKTSRKYRPKKESPWQLSQYETIEKKPLNTNLSSSLVDEVDPLTDNFLSKLEENLMESDDMLHDLHDEVISNNIQPVLSNKESENKNENLSTFKLNVNKINSIPERNLNPEAKLETYELKSFITSKPSDISIAKNTKKLHTEKTALNSNKPETGTGIERLNPSTQDSVKSPSGMERYDILDVTVEELDNALLKELPQVERGVSQPAKLVDNEKGLQVKSPIDFSSEVRNMESEIHDIVSSTARVSLTSSNLDLAMAKNMLKQLSSEKGYFYEPSIRTKDVNRVLLSYFYFVRLKDENSCRELQGKLFYIN